MLEFHAVTKTYEEVGERHVILDRLDARFEAGEHVAVIGRSGSGKTTLLNLGSGIDVPDAGDVSIGGTSLGGLDDGERTRLRRRQLGFVFQSYNLVPTLNVLDNVRLPLELGGASRATSKARAAAMLDEVGLAKRLTAFPDRLSGGEQQRVAVARALVHEPKLVLADEPTGNLDIDTAIEVMALLVRLTAAHGGLLLTVTHSVEAARLAGRCLRLTRGALVPADLSLG